MRLPASPAPRSFRRPTCTQCGAPHEDHESACAYCLSPKDPPAAHTRRLDDFQLNLATAAAESRIYGLVEITTLGDSGPRYIAMQDESFRN